MTHTALRFATLALVFYLSPLSISGAQVTIDAFDQGALALFGGSTGADAFVSGLDESRTLGGSRSVRLSSVTSPQTTLTIFDGGSPGLVMTVPAQADGGFSISYGGELRDPAFMADFYENNQVGFEFVFEEAPNSGRLFIGVNASNGFQSFSDFNLMLSGRGVYRIPYAEITDEFGPEPVDMNFASGLFWGIFDLPRHPNETQLAISSFRTYSVPEPGSIALLSLAGVAIAVRRPQKGLRRS